MSFISYTYSRYDPATKQYIYTLTDSEFGAVDVGVEVEIGVEVRVVVREYSKRGLPVGRNIALLVLYMHERNKYSIADLKRWQDRYCYEHIENWEMYAKERDSHLEKLTALLP